MENLAIIPARGGSKRIPRKNIKDFLGKPIIAYSVETALNSGLFEEVMISTEDQEIADIAQQCGASVPFFRSKNNASDIATTVDVLLEVVEEFENRKKFFKNVCCIYPTAPFVTKQDLKKGLEFLNEATSALSVAKFDFPVLRALKKDDKGNMCFAWPEYEKSRSQDLETYYHDGGQWYWIEVKSLKVHKSLITPSTKVVVKDRLHVQDIDTEEDWKLAELKYSLMNE